jgi:hypothetical protein
LLITVGFFILETAGGVLRHDSVYGLPDSISVKRSKSNLNLTLLADSISREYIVKPFPNRAFFYNNILWLYAAPIAYAIDLTTPKRFCYGDEIFLDTKDTSSVIITQYQKNFEDYFYQSYPTKNSKVNLFLSLPHINSFRMQPEGEPRKINTGFWGVSAGFEYLYRYNRFISIHAVGVTDLFVPVPAPYSVDYPYELMKSGYIGITDNFKFNRFTFGFGLCYTNNIWELSDYKYLNDDDYEFFKLIKSHRTLGGVINAYHRVCDDIFIGVTYRPTFFKVKNPGELSYEHLISLSTGRKFRIKK